MTNGTLKEWKLPGYASMKILKSEIDDKEIYKQSEYRSMVGKVMYLVNKLDVICLKRISAIFQESNKTTMESIDEVDRSHQIKHRKRSNSTKTKRIEIGSVHRLRKDEKDRKIITGGVVTMGGSPTYFTSKIQTTVSLSSTEAEYIALRMITQEVMFHNFLTNYLEKNIRD